MTNKDDLFIIINKFKDTDLCNSFIKSTFLKYLIELTENASYFTISDLSEDEVVKFELICQHNNRIKIVFEFWRMQVNIYLGKYIHYGDDAPVENENQQNQFDKALNEIFYNSIHEIISSNSCKILLYNSLNTNVKEVNSLNNYELASSENFYEPWLIEK